VNMTRKLRPLAALAMVALMGAGCGNTPAETGNTGTGSSSGGNENATNRDKAVKFADCMRDNGVAEFPDPTAKGDFRYGIEQGSPLDPSSAAWKAAISACKTLEPPGLLGSKATPKEMTARLKFARCMRDNGFKDFPDPIKDGPLIDTNRLPSAAGRGARDIPGFDAAIHKCLKVYDGSQGGQ
jgi:hypothetical protein